MKTKLSISLAFGMLFTLMGTSAEAATSNPWETANDGTAICKADPANTLFPDKLGSFESRYILVGNGAYQDVGCDHFITEFMSTTALVGTDFERVAWCANDGDFYTELCEAKETSVITTADLDSLESDLVIDGIENRNGRVMVYDYATYSEVMG